MTNQKITYVNAPRYLLRKYCILKLLKGAPPGYALDIGCGAGDLCETLHSLGYKIKGIDFSLEAVEFCKKRLNHLADTESFEITQGDLFKLEESFDIIFMCEVLEHIEDDKGALTKVNQLLNPKGRLILSVPAHQKWFGPSDHWAGHFRRYDKAALIQLFHDCGFDVEHIWSYGFPLANLTEIVRNSIYAKKDIHAKEEHTKQSGINRDEAARFRFFYKKFFMLPFCWLQMPFVHANISTGHLVNAVKR